MTEISPEFHEEINGTMNNLLKNFKLLHEKQKNGDENILKLEKHVAFSEEKIDSFIKEDSKFIKEL